MRLIFGLILASASASALSQQAPFCVVSQTGSSNCHYYNLQACQQAAKTLGGACAFNQQQASTQVQPVHTMVQPADVVGSFQRGQAEGQRLKLEREQHAAQMRLLEAKTAEINARTAPQPPPPPAGLVLYRCPQPDGVPFYTATAAVGCVVVAIQQ